MKKLLTSIVLLGALFAAGAFVLKQRGSAAEIESAASAEIVAPQRKDLRQTVQATGRVVSNRDVEIKSKASGQVIRIPFDVSDVVKQGDLMVEIDPVEQLRNVQKAEAALAASRARVAQAGASLEAAKLNYEAQMQEAGANLRSSRAKAVDARAKANREAELLKRGQSSVEDAETAGTTALQAELAIETAQAALTANKAKAQDIEAMREEINLSQAQVVSDEIALSLANQYLSETRVMSPIDGIVSVRDIQEGQIISSGISNVGGGTAVLTVSDLSRVFVLASVDESLIGGVVLGQQVEITADACPRVQFEGEVVRIAVLGENLSNVITFEVKVEVTGANKSLLKPEMTANVDIVVAAAAQALTIPIGAVNRGPEGDFALLRKPGSQEDVPVAVTAGINDGADTEILSGLSESDFVVWRKTTEDSEWRAQSGGFGPPPPF